MTLIIKKISSTPRQAISKFSQSKNNPHSMVCLTPRQANVTDPSPTFMYS